MAIELPMYTVDDLDQFPDDGTRFELLDGMLLVTPMPRAAHQIVANRFQFQLTKALERHAHVVGPGVITVRPKTQLQPDVLVYPAHFSPELTWEKVTEHWLAIEILSRSSRTYDREFKRDAYFALGVQEVWLVDLWNGSVEVCRGRGAGRWFGDVVRWQAPSVNIMVSVDLREVFAGLDIAT